MNAFHIIIPPRCRLRGCINGLPNVLKVASVLYMPLVDLSLINQTSPLFACLFAALFLGERLSIADGATIAAGLTGAGLGNKYKLTHSPRARQRPRALR